MFDSTLNLTGNTFQNNFVTKQGGAAAVYNSILNLARNTFQYNSADRNGGALSVWSCTINLTGNTFQDNAVYHDGGAITINTITHSLNHDGGSLNVEYSKLDLTGNTFQNNSACNDGGALHVEYSALSLTGNTFQNNSANNDGGALYAWASSLGLTENTIQNNYAVFSGGAQYLSSSIIHFIGNTFHKSYAAFGGTLHISTSNVTFTDDCFTDSYAQLGGAILVTSNSVVRMHNNITIGNNTAQYGGGMAAVDSRLEVLENTSFDNNRARYGGGLYVHNTEFNGYAMFTKNSVTEGGGGIYASRSTFFLTNNTMIIANNSALDGGGLLLSGDSKLYQQTGSAVHLISNSARSTGGAIKVEESNPLSYCISAEINFDVSNIDCFFQIQQKMKPLLLFQFNQFKTFIDSLNVSPTMHFDNNSAIEAGTDLYGGSVDNCKLNNFELGHSYVGSTAIGGYLFDVINNERKPTISSNPLLICACRNGLPNCTSSFHPGPVYPGGTLEVPIIALGQRNGTTAAVILIVDTSNNIKFSSLEYSQKINNTCNTLKYTIFSHVIGTTQEMTLYAQGPCSPSQNNTLIVSVIIQHCPPGFQLSTNKPICICDTRLQHFTNTCLVDSKTVLRVHNAEFWVGYDSDSESRGLILHPNCPFDYCTSKKNILVS